MRILSVGTGANRMVLPPNAPAGHTFISPPNAPLEQEVVIEATGFGTQISIVINRTPVSGPALGITETTIDNANAANSGTVLIPLDFPPNVPITLNVWTR